MSKVAALAGFQVFTPPMQCDDKRGDMWSWYETHLIPDHIAHEATVARSGPGVLRGIHYDPRRAKHVTCLHGAIYDVVVDLRQGSPTFGDWTSALLTGGNRKAVYVPAGLGHSYLALEYSIAVYLYDTPFDPEHYYGINPLDKRLDIEWPWPEEDLILSDKDASAPGLDQARWLPEVAGA